MQLAQYKSTCPPPPPGYCVGDNAGRLSDSSTMAGSARKVGALGGPLGHQHYACTGYPPIQPGQGGQTILASRPDHQADGRLQGNFTVIILFVWCILSCNYTVGSGVNIQFADSKSLHVQVLHNEHRLFEEWAANDCVRWTKDEANYEYIPTPIKTALGIFEVSDSDGSESEGQL
jgi:hypothetical protein